MRKASPRELLIRGAGDAMQTRKQSQLQPRAGFDKEEHGRTFKSPYLISYPCLGDDTVTYICTLLHALPLQCLVESRALHPEVPYCVSEAHCECRG